MNNSPRPPFSRENIFQIIALLFVLIIGAYFRFTGLMWADYEYPHPDERFLVWVVADISPVNNLSEYFDTATSSLNPANRGHAFYVYGDFPVIAVRYVTEALTEIVGWKEILQVGRGLSAVFDLVTVLLVYLVVNHLSNWRVATLAGLLSSSVVLQIQQSHFFTVDSFSTTFTTLAIYLAVLLATEHNDLPKWAIIRYSIFLGIVVGLAMSCKLNTLPIAALLPAALGIRWLSSHPHERLKIFLVFAIAALAGGLSAIFIFRITQPYAFKGPGFFDINLDEAWLKSIRDLSAQSAGDVDFPPALQWARRKPWFSLQNLALWGLGVPLAGLSWFGFFTFLIVGIRKFRKDGFPTLLQDFWPGVFLVWIWTAFYFTWQSTAWNPTMRYQLPIYPTLTILGACVIGYAWRYWTGTNRKCQILVGGAGALVLLLTMTWAFAFTRMYTRTETRVAASQWIFDNISGPVNLEITTRDGDQVQLLPVAERTLIHPDFPYLTRFEYNQQGKLASVHLANLLVTVMSEQQSVQVNAKIFDPQQPDLILAVGQANIPPGSHDSYEIPINNYPTLEAGKQYQLSLEVQPSPLGSRSSENRAFVSVQIEGSLKLILYNRVQVVEEHGSALDLSNIRLEEEGTLRQIEIIGEANISSLTIMTSNQSNGDQQIAQASLKSPGIFEINPPMTFLPGITYVTSIVPIVISGSIDPETDVRLVFLDDIANQMLPGISPVISEEEPLWLQFSSRYSGQLTAVQLGYAASLRSDLDHTTLQISLKDGNNISKELSTAQIQIESMNDDPRGNSYRIELDQSVELEKDHAYIIAISPQENELAQIRGSAIANESPWDMGLPFRTSGYDPFGGIYRSDLDFDMYSDDNEEKYQRFINILDQTDYIMISSNRQWGTTTRLPERHPLTTAYYRALIGCPEEQEVIWCYNVAEVGSYQGQLGFDLIQTFTSYPNIGPLKINTQFAEEAFTVYDHPKVFIFKKNSSYDPALARAVLDQVDLSQVVRITPKKAARFKNMLLTDVIWKIQQSGGTWSELFPPESLLNRFPLVGLVAFYLFVLILGWIVYPILRLSLPGLTDHGYPLARIAGLLLLAYPAWLMGSLRVPVTRTMLAFIVCALIILSVILAWVQRKELIEEFRKQPRYFLRVEILASILFIACLLIRLGNPDLWHPIYGGEKPMNFSQFNAVLKSTVFPPYDPWFAGGSLNYYYFGYVLVGMPVKLLGITPSIAYNLLIPTLFSMVGLAAFSIASNLSSGFTQDSKQISFKIGLVAVLALLILGNLGTVRMLWEGPQKLIVSDEQIRQGNVFDQIHWSIEGMSKLLTGQAPGLPYSVSDWYWKPSRAIQPESGSEITEFPFFTFLYADLHAHLMTLPLTLLVIGWAISILLNRGRWKHTQGIPSWLAFSLTILFGALAVGALRPANTWDQYTYMPLAGLALFYGQWQSQDNWGRIWRSLLPTIGLILLALLLFSPFDWWFGQGYNQVTLWEGAKTGLGSYLVHWGLFLFIIASWIIQELVTWMDETPLSAMHKLRPFREVFLAGIILVILVMAIFLFKGIVIILIIAPLGLAVVALILRPGQTVEKRAVMFMIGTALMITLAVEIVAVQGDINRMNTVFKFYFQAWSLFSLSAAASFGWLLTRMNRPGNWVTAWICGLIILVFGAALYPITAIRGKIADRMTPEAPNSLDGMDYMAFSTYSDGPDGESYQEMDLTQDYYAIRWVQEHVPGSPVIVEANTPEYRHWGTRFTIYTGLPAVVGWNWHERQQRTLTPDTWVYERIEDVKDFYTTTNLDETEKFLSRYDVGIIVVGQLERIYYSGTGLDKFHQQDGILWTKIYEDSDTVLYQVR